MGFFIDKQNRRKSPVALAAVGAGIVNLILFGILYAYLAEPLYRLIAFPSADWTNILHSVIVALIETGIGCLWFLLPDKRVAPYGFVCLALFVILFLLSTILLDAEARGVMLYVIAMYGIAPAVIGNAVIWCIYTLWNRKHPQGQRKTLREELQAGMEREAKCRKTPDDRSKPEQPSEQNRENTPEEAAYPPENQSKLEQEAMLFYSENSDSDES